jgi:hypothetical protein
MAKATTAVDWRSEHRAAEPRPKPATTVTVLPRHRDHWSWALGGLISVATTVVYMIGSSRAISDVDSSVTVAAFIKTHSIFDPLRRTVTAPGMRNNNHPLFSLLDHAVWSSGFHSEAALRVVPIVCAALAVGLLVVECSRRFGLLSGACAGLVLAANPLFAFLSREMRGYSLITLAAVASTILLSRIVTSEHPRRWQEILYVVALAAGIATHLWFALVFVIHLAIVLARRQFNVRWIVRFALGAVLGSLVYLRVIGDMLGHQQTGAFHATFPTKTVHVLLGHQKLAVAIIGLVVIYGFVLTIRRIDVVAAVASVAAIIGVFWLIIQPLALAPRYFVWFIPAFGLAIAIAVSRRPWIAALILVAVVCMVADQYASWTVASPESARAAGLVDAARADHLRVCSYKGGNWAIIAYTRPGKPVQGVGIQNCDVLVEMRYPLSVYEKKVKAELPYIWSVPGANPVEVFSRIPIPFLVANPAYRQLTLNTHAKTYP